MGADVFQRVNRAYQDRQNLDCTSTAEAMHRLGVGPRCNMWMFYMAINGALPPMHGKLELLRIVGPGIPKIPDQAEYVGIGTSSQRIFFRCHLTKVRGCICTMCERKRCMTITWLGMISFFQVKPRPVARTS